MSSPAERYAAARRRTAHPTLAGFAAELGFSLDPFQVEACEALDEGAGVLVCAPTGAGKTVVGEFAVHKALAEGRKAFYTTPIKALSNQKYNDLVDRYGADRVGLLTGDNAVNGDAPVVVMTTEVLRNMLYAESPAIDGLGYVIMDEVHYLADRFRGAVWEEVIIHLPQSVTLVSLSATVSNAEEFADWLVTVRGHTRVVVSEVRPIPLWQHMLVGNRVFDLFSLRPAAHAAEQDGTPREQSTRERGASVVDPELVRYVREHERRIDSWHGGGGGAPPGGGSPPPPPSAGCPACGSPTRGNGPRSPRSSTAAPARCRRRTCTSSASGSGGRACWPGWPRTTPAWSRRSRRPSRSASSAAWSRPCSPPRPSPWASTCRRAPSSWSGWSSGTARRTSTSRRGSTPSSPGGPAAAASTSRGTPSSSGRRAWTPRRSPGWPAPAPTRCGPASGPATTWPSTWSAPSAGPAPGSCWPPRSPSSRPTGRSWGSPGPPPATSGTPSAGPRRCTPRAGTSPGTRGCARRSPTGRRSCPATRRPSAGWRPPRRSRRCGPVTSSGCRRDGGRGWPSSSTPG